MYGPILTWMEKENERKKETILQLEFEKKELDTKVLESLRDQLTNEKSSSEAEKQIREVKEKIAGIDAKLKIEKNKLIDLDRKIEAIKLLEVTERHRKDQLTLQTSQLEEEERKVSETLRTTTNAIDKVQNLINHAEKEFSNLSAKVGEGRSPLEAEIAKCREEMDLVSQYCTEKRKEWIKKQNQLIKIHLQQDQTRQELEQVKNKYNILLEKRSKNEEDIRDFKDELNKVLKRIDGLDVKIKKLNKTIADSKADSVALESKMNAKVVENTAAVREIQEEIETLKTEISSLETSQHFALGRVREADRELGEWEDKVRACQSTASHMGEEKQKGGELENLKSEVHYLEQKLKEWSQLITQNIPYSTYKVRT